MGTKTLVYKDKRSGLKGSRRPFGDYTIFATGRVFGFHTPWRIARRNRSHTLLFKMGCQEAVLSTLTRQGVTERYCRYAGYMRPTTNPPGAWHRPAFYHELAPVDQAQIRSIISAVNRARKLAKYPMIVNYPA